MERQGSAQVDLLTSTSSTLADSLRLSSSRSLQTLKELTGCCSDLHGSVTGREPLLLVTLGRPSGFRSLLTPTPVHLSAAGLRERGAKWSSRAKELVEVQAQGQRAFMESVSSEAETLQKVKLSLA